MGGVSRLGFLFCVDSLCTRCSTSAENALVFKLLSPSSILVKDVTDGLLNSPIRLGLILRLTTSVRPEPKVLFFAGPQETDSGVAQGR